MQQPGKNGASNFRHLLALCSTFKLIFCHKTKYENTRPQPNERFSLAGNAGPLSPRWQAAKKSLGYLADRRLKKSRSLRWEAAKKASVTLLAGS